MRSFIGLGVLLAAVPASARTLVVRPGRPPTIQEAVNRASAGDRIVVHPGTYIEGGTADTALTITKDGIELVGLSSSDEHVILASAGTQSYGIWVSPANSLHDPARDDEDPLCAHPDTAAVLRGFSIRGFTIRGFATHGVHLACVDGFSIVDNRSEDNRVYGLFPVLSRHGLVAGNVVTGTTDDAAVYVGQSERVLITGNRVDRSLIGIEIENCGNCAAVANEIHDNTAGILVDLLPGLQRGTLENTLVAFNSVRDNNRTNNATEGVLSVLPAGSGIVVVGGRRTTVLANDVRTNGFVGIGVATYCFAYDQLRKPGDPDCHDLGIDPDPRDDRVIGNRLKGNGTDLIWIPSGDGTSDGNCWSGNKFTTSSPAQLPSCQ
jgi:parallel beta-helix repeat protein